MTISRRRDWVALVVSIGWTFASHGLAGENQAVQGETHRLENAVYRELLVQGVAAGDAVRKLPNPTLADEMTADEQASVLAELGGNRYPLDRLTRPSVVAPQIIRISPPPARLGQPLAAPWRTVDVWFVVHVPLETLADDGLLGQLLGSEGGGGQATPLGPEQLAARGIPTAAIESENQLWAYLVYDLLDRVRVQAAGRSAWSRTAESIIAAGMIDPRFRDDATFANQWMPLDRQGGDADSSGATLYEGFGFYVKATQLKPPLEGVLIEFHLVFQEPEGWFAGTNQFGAKLPAVIQSQVREARRTMLRAAN